jgi:hypothetical protein
MQFFYDLPYEFSSPQKESFAPTEPLLKTCAPEFMVKLNTVGGYFEVSYWRNEMDLPTAELERAKRSTLLSLLYRISRMAEILPLELGDVDFGELNKRYFLLEKAAVAIDRRGEGGLGDMLGKLQTISWEEIEDRVAAITYACRLSSLKAVWDEYIRRIREIKQSQFLGYFLKKNPGIQHKAGVPLGGTFILVYHQNPDIPRPVAKSAVDRASTTYSSKEVVALEESSSETLSGAFMRLERKKMFVDDPDFQVLFSEFTGRFPRVSRPYEGAVINEVDRTIVKAVDEFADGTVIADFYLPYLCCSDCTPLQYVLPPPSLEFSVELGCTNRDTRKAEATITLKGGDAPFSYKLDSHPFVALAGNLALEAGSHTLVVRDSSGAESTLHSITVPEALSIGPASYTDIPQTNSYQVTFSIFGGTAPYKDSQGSGVVKENIYTSDPVASGKQLKVEIVDSKSCRVSNTFTHTVCTLPCEGKAIRCGYVFWLPEPTEKRKIEKYKAAITLFRFFCPDGKEIDLGGLLKVGSSPDSLNTNFTAIVAGWIKEINAAIAKHTRVRSDDWFKLDYRRYASSGFGALIVEHFSCQPFVIQIKEEFSYRGPVESRTVEYTEKGTQIDIERFPSVQVPVFGCEETNKCLPKHEWNPRCSGVNFELEMHPPSIDKDSVVTLVADYSGAEKPVEFLWEVQDAVPSLLVGQNVKTKLEQFDPRTTMVRLTAFSRTGCTVSIERTVNAKLW